MAENARSPLDKDAWLRLADSLASNAAQETRNGAERRRLKRITLTNAASLFGRPVVSF
jgi:hypothetical protein